MDHHLPFLVWFGWYCVVGIVMARFVALSRPKVRRQMEKLGAYGIGAQAAAFIILILTWPVWGTSRLFRLVQHLIHEREIIARSQRAYDTSRELEDQMKTISHTDPDAVAEVKEEFEDVRQDYHRTIALVVKCPDCRKKLEKLGIPLPPEERHEWEL
jgi:hypothetical protein